MIPGIQIGLRRGEWAVAEERATLQDRVADLFMQLRDPLFRYLYVILKNAEEAEDSAQECFFRLFLELQSGAKIHDVKAWLFRVGHNLAIDRQRRHQGRKEESLESSGMHFLDRRSPSSEEDLLRRERLSMVNAAVNRLSPQQRLCLHLRTEGFRYREIAQIAGVSDSTVSENLRRGLSRLMKHFGSEA